ncbi:hypothetical protein PIB30_017641 [Stylosanthes scabra]|uniref:Uncharacterized protein n=1 Tax=Stylosanthes scabra TaxID=79078 RepID=A0ABU6W780_9FABA|nr:hypothetical protein [Stylosanthes scabra]
MADVTLVFNTRKERKKEGEKHANLEDIDTDFLLEEINRLKMLNKKAIKVYTQAVVEKFYQNICRWLNFSASICTD